MLLQICRDYHALPDLDTITLDQIRFFYEGLRDELKKLSAPKAQASRAPRARPKGRPARTR
jgi:hypothetical protein